MMRPQPQSATGLLLSAMRMAAINRQWQVPTSSCAAAQHSAANASSVTFTADVGN